MALKLTPARTPSNVTLNTCFTPDLYAIVWSINRNGDVLSYNTRSGVWADHGLLRIGDGTVIGSFALAFNNDPADQAIYVHVNGTLYKSFVSAPTAAQVVGSSEDPIFGTLSPRSVGAAAIRPGTREMWVNSGATNIAAIVDLDTGQITNLGQITDARDGAALDTQGGDWAFAPDGSLWYVTRDFRGATFGQDTEAVYFVVDTGSLIATRVSNTDNPIGNAGASGASWASPGRFFSSNSGSLVSYYPGQDTVPGSDSAWSVESAAPKAMNDLDSQWVQEPSVPVVVCIEKDKQGNVSDGNIYTIRQDDSDPTQVYFEPFEPAVPGRFGGCEAISTDPDLSLIKSIEAAVLGAERESSQGRVIKFSGGGVQSLPVSAGTKGVLVAIEDTGGGRVYFSTASTILPDNLPGDGKGEVSGASHAGFHLKNVDLSELRFAGSLASSEYVVWYEVYS